MNPYSLTTRFGSRHRGVYTEDVGAHTMATHICGSRNALFIDRQDFSTSKMLQSISCQYFDTYKYLNLKKGPSLITLVYQTKRSSCLRLTTLIFSFRDHHIPPPFSVLSVGPGLPLNRHKLWGIFWGTTTNDGTSSLITYDSTSMTSGRSVKFETY